MLAMEMNANQMELVLAVGAYMTHITRLLDSAGCLFAGHLQGLLLTYFLLLSIPSLQSILQEGNFLPYN